MIVDRGGHCDTADEHNIKSVSLSGQGKNCFIVTEAAAGRGGSSQISVIFSAPSDSDRVDWLEKLIEAFNGTKHDMPDMGIGLAKSPTRAEKERPTSTAKPTTQVQIEFPKIIGALKKKAVGGSFGVRTVKKRWFKLEAGELRYYSEEKMKPSTLKGTVQIAGSQLIPEKDKKALTLQMADGKKLEMEADSESMAIQWSDAIKETISILTDSDGGGEGGRGRKKKERRDDVDRQQQKPLSSTRKSMVPSVSYKTTATKDFIKAALQDHFLLGTLEDFNPLIDALTLQVLLETSIKLFILFKYLDINGRLIFI